MSTRQLGLFDDIPIPVEIADPNVPPEARKRMSRQCVTILCMLRGGTRTASELAAITHRFGGRLYDLRRAGCAIECDYEPTTGLATYTLKHEPEGLT